MTEITAVNAATGQSRASYTETQASGDGKTFNDYMKEGKGIPVDSMRLIPLQDIVAASPKQTFQFSETLWLDQQGPLFKLSGPDAANYSIEDTIMLHQNRHLGAAALDLLKTSKSVEGRDPTQIGSGASYKGDSGADYATALWDSKLEGGAGGDHLSGMEGSTLDGGEGADILSLMAGKGKAYGGAGSDYLTGAGWLDGGEDDDSIYAGRDSDIFGGAGNDYIKAEKGSRIDGGDGDDYIESATDSTVSGGRGDDTMIVSERTTLVYKAGDGHDTLGSRVGLNPALRDFMPWMFDRAPMLDSATLALKGIDSQKLTVSMRGADMVVGWGSETDSITIANAETSGVPTLLLDDGTMIDGRQLRSLVA